MFTIPRLATAFALIATLALGISPARASAWEFDSSHTAAYFTVRHMMVSNVRGEFSNISGTINLDEGDITKSSVEVSVDASTVNTREPKRDTHLKSPDFFDVAKFPKISFKSQKVEQLSPGKLKLTGDLTLHGITKTVVFEVEGPTPEMKAPWGGVRRGATATAKINRKDFGLNWNKALEAGGVLVSDEVTITIDIEMTKKK